MSDPIGIEQDPDDITTDATDDDCSLLVSVYFCALCTCVVYVYVLTHTHTYNHMFMVYIMHNFYTHEYNIVYYNLYNYE